MLKSIKKFLPLLAVAALLSGCMSAKKMTYLLDMAYNTDYPAHPAPELTIVPGDCLGISVSSQDPVLAAPFNFLASNGESSSATARYTVDSQGNIAFPVLGRIPVSGKTLNQIREDIASRISREGYIKEPLIGVTLENFTVTVIGNTGNSVLPVTDPSINILQVIARSGGTTADSKIKDVMVVRTENGSRQAYTLNLQKKDIFESPVFYLKQNDVVYVKPQGSTLSSEGQMVMTFVGSGLTLASIITNFLLWSRR